MTSKRIVGVVLAVLMLPCFSLLSFAQHSSAPPPDTDEQRIADMIMAYRILVNEGVLDSFGHISVRSVKNPNHYFMPRAMPPSKVTVNDIIELDLDSNPIDPKAPRTNGERFIHGEIYKARPDVQAVIHAHSVAMIPLGVAGVPLRPVLAQAGFLPLESPIFEVRDAFAPGEKDRGMLIRTPKIAAAMARKLGNAPVILLRGHGENVVADSIRRATVQAVYADIDARAQWAAMMLNKNITAMDAQELAFNKVENFDIERPWEAFVLKLEEKH